MPHALVALRFFWPMPHRLGSCCTLPQKKKGFVAFFATKMPQIFDFTNKKREIGEICGMSH